MTACHSFRCCLLPATQGAFFCGVVSNPGVACPPANCLLCHAVPTVQERDQLSATAEGASRLRFKMGELAQVGVGLLFLITLEGGLVNFLVAPKDNEPRRRGRPFSSGSGARPPSSLLVSCATFLGLQKQSELDGMLMTARMRLAALFSASQGGEPELLLWGTGLYWADISCACTWLIACSVPPMGSVCCSAVVETKRNCGAALQPADLPQPAELHNRVATVVQQRQREVAEVNESLKRLQGEVGCVEGKPDSLLASPQGGPWHRSAAAAPAATQVVCQQ